MKRLILVGGGHAHVFILRQLALSRRTDIEALLISPSVWTYYSGMLPGWMAGHYREEECRIDLSSLAARALVRLVPQAAVGLDVDRCEVCLRDGMRLTYDLLSLDIGSETDCEPLSKLGDRLIPVKPLLEFQTAWTRLMDAARGAAAPRIVVVGGGAAGVELAMAAQCALGRVSPAAQVVLVSGEAGVVPTHGVAVRRRVMRALERLGVGVVAQRAAGVPDGVLLDDGRRLEADQVIAATGARAPAWLAPSRLALDAEGYVAVDAFHRSASHKNVFAAGDVCSRKDASLARSGVHAVRAGPVLARNLLAALDGRALDPFIPSRRSLYLLSTGDGRAIASWGSLSAEGAWVWRLKDAIDRRFIRQFSVGATGRARPDLDDGPRTFL